MFVFCSHKVSWGFVSSPTQSTFSSDLGILDLLCWWPHHPLTSVRAGTGAESDGQSHGSKHTSLEMTTLLPLTAHFPKPVLYKFTLATRGLGKCKGSWKVLYGYGDSCNFLYHMEPSFHRRVGLKGQITGLCLSDLALWTWCTSIDQDDGSPCPTYEWQF